MEVNPTDTAGHLVKADVVKPFEARPGYGADSVIRYQEVLLPSHEYVFSLRIILIAEIGYTRLARQRFPCRESAPVLHVGFLRRTPLLMPGLEGVLGANDLALKVCGEGWVIVGEPLNTQVAAYERLLHIDMLYLHLDIVDLAVRLLRAYESRSRFEEG